MKQSQILLTVLFNILISNCNAQERPNIIIIVADDLGWNDVGFHGSNEVKTPNIDALAYDGTILNNYYVNPICSPSRSALMTGLHPIHTGLQHGVIGVGEDRGVPLTVKLLPEYLAELGYKSHAVGKWHLGYSRQEYLPTSRGFESHYGYWAGMQDYYSHTLYKAKEGWGYDFRDNMTVAWQDYGKYATDLFTQRATQIIRQHDKSRPLFLYLAHLAVHSANPYDPLQVPRELLSKFSYIADPQRRKFAGMLWKLDQSVGAIVQALNAASMLNNCIIVFTTDNGGPAGGFDNNAASNWPLRGVKHTLWEGGIRGSAFLWTSSVQQQSVETRLWSITDWLPTLYCAAGGEVRNLPASLDGTNRWNFGKKCTSPTDDQDHVLLHNIDKNSQALRMGRWKFIKSEITDWQDWYGPSGAYVKKYDMNEIKSSPTVNALLEIGRKFPSFSLIEELRGKATIVCNNTTAEAHCDLRKGCLFNIQEDPCEKKNEAGDYPHVVKKMKERLRKFEKTAMKPSNVAFDKSASPNLWGYVWTNWKDFH